MSADRTQWGLVQTVLGPIEPAELGITLPHEHIVIDFAPLWRPPLDIADLEIALGPFDASLRLRVNHDPNLVLDAIGNPIAHALIGELRRYRALGGDSVVDVTPIGVGRHPHLLAAVSRLTGLHIVMSTAFYIESFHPPFLHVADEDTIARHFIRDLTEGADGSTMRAGLIGEIGTGNPSSEQEIKVVRAAATAHLETGVSVNLHRTSYPDPDEALVALDLLLGLGVAPNRIVMSHCDERPGAGFALEVAQRGAYVELDTWGMEMWATRWMFDSVEIPAASDTDRLTILGALLERGYLEQILLSQDVCNKAQLRTHGGYGYAHLLESVRDQMRLVGISADEERTMLQENPQRMLTPSIPAT